MRDPKRTESILNTLREVWEKNPDWRLGQVIMVAVRSASPCPEVFSIEDADLQHRLAKLSDQSARTH